MMPQVTRTRQSPLTEEAWELSKEALGPNDRDTLKALGRLAQSYQAARRFEKAFELRQKTLELRSQYLGPEDPDTLTAMRALADSFLTLGLPDVATCMLEVRAGAAAQGERPGPSRHADVALRSRCHPEKSGTGRGSAGVCQTSHERATESPWRQPSGYKEFGKAGSGAYAKKGADGSKPERRARLTGSNGGNGEALTRLLASRSPGG